MITSRISPDNIYRSDLERVYRSGLDLEALTDANILVTGATGLIGTCVVDMLMCYPQRRYHVYAAGRNRQRAMDRFACYMDDKDFTFIEFDVTQTLESDIPFHYIIDAASLSSPNFFKNHPVEVIRANINGVGNLLDYGVGHALKRLLYVSSGEVYGEGDGTPFTEKSSGFIDCATARACYPSAKRTAETLCVAYAEEYHTDAVIARLCHTYGPWFTESDNRVYAQFIRNVLNNEDIVLKSEGRPYRSWLYVVDCAHALLRLLLSGASANAYNVADAEANITIRDLAERVAKLAHREVVFDIPEGQNHGVTTPITKATFSVEKIQSIGWHPLFSLQEGLEHTIKALTSVASA